MRIGYGEALRGTVKEERTLFAVRVEGLLKR